MYCLKCAKKSKEGPNCSRCGNPLHAQLSDQERTLLVQSLHRRENRLKDINDRAMSCLVLGTIFLIIGAIFLSLSYKLDLDNPSDNTRYLTMDSMEFWVALISLVGGGLAFVYGAIQWAVDLRLFNILRHDIAEIYQTSSSEVSKTPLWIVQFSKDFKIKLANRRALKAAEKKKTPSK